MPFSVVQHGIKHIQYIKVGIVKISLYMTLQVGLQLPVLFIIHASSVTHILFSLLSINLHFWRFVKQRKATKKSKYLVF